MDINTLKFVILLYRRLFYDVFGPVSGSILTLERRGPEFNYCLGLS